MQSTTTKKSDNDCAYMIWYWAYRSLDVLDHYLIATRNKEKIYIYSVLLVLCSLTRMCVYVYVHVCL